MMVSVFRFACVVFILRCASISRARKRNIGSSHAKALALRDNYIICNKMSRTQHRIVLQRCHRFVSSTDAQLALMTSFEEPFLSSVYS